MPQIDYHLMRHIILNVYIKLYLDKMVFIISDYSLQSSNKKPSSEPFAWD